MDALTQKLIRLRNRFARMKWDEQAHPRADDGKFGEGGGSGESKPAAQAPHATAEEADAWGAKNVVTEGGVNPSERDALIHYQASSGNYKYMNAELRTGVPDSDPRHGRAIKEIDSVMKRSTVKAPVIVLRGIPAKVAAKLNLTVGTSYQDKGFCSTTANQTTANKFSASGALEGTLCEIHVPAGAHAVYLHSMSESELLLDRGARFEVTEVSHGGRRVKMTLIPKGTARSGAPQPRITSSLSGATTKQHDEDAGNLGRFSWGESDLEPVKDEEDDAEEPVRKPATVVPWEGNTLAARLTRLRDRFARLKGADWSEQDHPRADDGTFGAGGGGGGQDDSAEETPHEQASREWGERAEERGDRREYLEETQGTVDDWEETNRQGTLSVDAAGEGVKTGTYDHDEFRAAINEHLAATVKTLHDIQNSLHSIGADADDLEAFDALVAAGKKNLLAAALAYSGAAKKTAAAAANLAALTETEPDLPDEPEVEGSDDLPPEPDADEYDDGEDNEAYQAAQEEYESATAAHEAAEKAHDDWENECASIQEKHAAAIADAQTTLDELGESLGGHAATFDEAVAGLIAAAQDSATAILDGAREDLTAADAADPEPVRKPSTVAPWEGDTTAAKLLRLRDRFRGLLKWDEFHHPRDDDGKFGSGGGGGASAEDKPSTAPAKPAPAKPAPKKPAAKPKPAAKKPAKPAKPAKPVKPPKADAAKVHAGIADLLASGEPLTTAHVARIATSLQGLTVKEIQAVKAKLGIKASGAKTALAQSIAEKAVASVKAKPAAPVAPKPEAMPTAAQVATPKPEGDAAPSASSAPQQAPAKFAADDVSRHLDGPGRTAAEKEIAHTAAHLDKAGKAVVRKFTGKLYVEINKEVRSGKPGKHRKTIDALRQTIDAAPVLDKPVTVYRGASLKPADRAKIMAAAEKALAEGGEMAMKGFTSTSLSPFKAENFARQYHANEPLMLEMSCQKGVYCEGLTHEKGELEFLTNDGARYRVKGIKKIRYGHPDYPGKNIQTIQLEQIV